MLASSSSHRRRCFTASAPAFTLVELLIVLGIIVLLVSILLPAINAARRRAMAVRCASNIRQICQGLHAYAIANHGRFPPSSPQRGYWCDARFIGKLLSPTVVHGKAPISEEYVGGGVLVCPEDHDDSVRSYTMNSWAASSLDPTMTTMNPPVGQQFRMGAAPSSSLILVAESFSGRQAGRVPNGWQAVPYIGLAGDLPGRRFGAGGGLSPPSQELGRFSPQVVELPYDRHSRRRQVSWVPSPDDAVHFGFLDGHVALLRAGELADFSTGRSRLVALWSPLDPKINN